MEIIYEKIFVSHQHSFITRKIWMDPISHKIHSHNNYELNYILSGSGNRIVGNSISSYCEGDLFLLGPNIPHCWNVPETTDNNPSECIVTHFYENIITSNFFNIPEPDDVVSLLKSAGNGIHFRGKLTEKVGQTLKKMVTLEGLPRYIELLRVFSLLLQLEDREELALPYSLPDNYDRHQEQINKIYEYVFRKIQSGIRLREAAAAITTSPTSTITSKP
jgi:hypothetical protein